MMNNDNCVIISATEKFNDDKETKNEVDLSYGPFVASEPGEYLFYYDDYQNQRSNR